jgi:small subunit ribosomal protein S17
MDKTIIVAVQWSQRDRLYRKPQRRITKFYADDSNNSCSLGDLVRIEETRPISRLKSWRLVDIIERREVAEVMPVELDQAFMESQMRGQDSEAVAMDDYVAEQAVDEVESVEADVEPVEAELEEPQATETEPVEAEVEAAEATEVEPVEAAVEVTETAEVEPVEAAVEPVEAEPTKTESAPGEEKEK